MTFTLYHYWRSSCSWRVRWALFYKGLDFTPIAINLLENEQTSAEHLKKNPKGAVPALALNDQNKTVLFESSAIIEFLEETHPSPRLLPKDPLQRAHCRALTQIVNAGIQPLQNLATMKFYSEDPEKRKSWSAHWIQEGLKAYEAAVQKSAGEFSCGNELSMADLFLIPQLYNARRFDVDLTPFPSCLKIEGNALKTESCQKAHPDRFTP
ncbi:MAG: maleylacetoacetate isomerase [Deltaproteobacteria bacterium]|nr:maleylacetoacetate isomerase [Deltaproteobacteria bacterium]